MLTGAIAILVLTLMGVVIANVSTPSNKSVVKLEPQPEPAQVDTIELALSSKPNTNDGVKYAAPIIDAKATNPEITKAQIQAVTVESLVAIETPTTIEMLTALETPVGHESTGLSAEKIETVTIKQGDTLSTLFSKRGLNTELYKIMLLWDQVKELKSVRPNQKLH